MSVIANENAGLMTTDQSEALKLTSRFGPYCLALTDSLFFALLSFTCINVNSSAGMKK